MKKRSSNEWLKEANEFGCAIVIHNPDGWDRTNYSKSMEEKITKDDFIKKIIMSTVHASWHKLNLWTGYLK